MDDVEHGVADAGAEVVDAHAAVRLLKLFERRDVSLGKIDHVDVVAHAGAVLRRVIVAENAEALELSDRDLRDIRDEIVRDAVRVLADHAALMRADRVEVAQNNRVEIRICVRVVEQDALDHQLRRAVGIRRRKREILADRNGRRVAVHGRRGAENEILDLELLHHLQKAQRGDEVVLIVPQRDLHRFADGLEACEMDDRKDLVLREDPAQRLRVADVRFEELHFFAAERFDAVHNERLAVDEIVDDRHVVSLFEQRDAGVASDVACAACNQNSHTIPSFPV